MPIHYTITYHPEPTSTPKHKTCGTDTPTLTFHLIQDGMVEYDDGSLDGQGRPIGARPVNLLTLYFAPDENGNWPSETFALALTYNQGYKVKEVYRHEDDHSPTLSPVNDRPNNRWTLTITGPTANNEVTNFQLATPGEAPPQKLKIRVKRQSGFTCATGPFDDVPGAEYPDP